MKVLWSRQKESVRGASRKQIKVSRKPFAWSRLLPPLLPTIVLGLVLLLSLVSYQASLWLQAQTVDRVVVTGDLTYTDHQQLADKVKPLLADGFFMTDLQLVQQRLLAMPWVYATRLERHWPGTLIVKVVEQQPIARWGDRGLLNQHGELFVPEQVVLLSDLPQLNGPDGSEFKVVQRFTELNSLLVPQGLKLRGLLQSSRGSWSGQLTNGVELLLGKEQLIKRAQRFLAVYQQQLKAEFERVSRIDLRYGNGMAVAWRKPVSGQKTINKA